MTTQVRASIVVSAFNAAATIERVVESYCSQTVAEIEILVFDDGSTDRTAALVARIDDARVQLLGVGRNVGKSAGRDAAIRRASAEVIVMADADDIALPHRVQSHLAVLDAHPHAVATYGRLREIRPNGAVLNDRFPVTVSATDAMFERGQMPVAHPASAFRSSWYQQTGGYDPSLPWAEDYDFFARGWRPGRIVPDDTVLVDYATNGATKPWRYWWENERHRRAVNARIASAGRRAARTTSIEPFLRSSSTTRRRAVEFARWAAVSVRDREGRR